MKLVLVADSFPPLRTSGAVQLRDLAREFARQGHFLTVLLPGHDLVHPWVIDNIDGVQVVRLRTPRTKDISYVRRALGEWLMPYAMRRNLRKSPLAREQWDGVIWYSPSIFHAPMVSSLKQQSLCKAYLIIRDIFPEWAADIGLMRRGYVYRAFKHIAQQQYDVADIIGVQTDGNLAYFYDWRQKLAGRQLEVLQNWLDKPVKTRCRIRIDDTPLAGRKIAVYAGNMGVAQGMDCVLDLADRMRARTDIGFLFVGRGSEVARMRGRAINGGLDNVFFYDEIDPNEITDLYSQCEVGIIALHARHKSHNIPGKFLTYIQSGLPVFAIVNEGNDLAHMIRQECVGEACETHAINQLEQQFLTLIENVEEDHLLSDRCARLFERQFSVAQTVRQLISALSRS